MQSILVKIFILGFVLFFSKTDAQEFENIRYPESGTYPIVLISDPRGEPLYLEFYDTSKIELISTFDIEANNPFKNIQLRNGNFVDFTNKNVDKKWVAQMFSIDENSSFRPNFTNNLTAAYLEYSSFVELFYHPTPSKNVVIAYYARIFNSDSALIGEMSFLKGFDGESQNIYNSKLLPFYAAYPLLTNSGKYAFFSYSPAIGCGSHRLGEYAKLFFINTDTGDFVQEITCSGNQRGRPLGQNSFYFKIREKFGSTIPDFYKSILIIDLEKRMKFSKGFNREQMDSIKKIEEDIINLKNEQISIENSFKQTKFN